jgi:hypothetical protein
MWQFPPQINQKQTEFKTGTTPLSLYTSIFYQKMYLQMYIITPHTQQALVFNTSPSSAKSLRHQPRKTNNYKPIIVHLKFNENPQKDKKESRNPS